MANQPKLINLKEILKKTKVKETDINKLSEKLLQVKFFDIYTKSQKKDNTINIYVKDNVEENMIEINLKEKNLTYYETISGITRHRKYTSQGFDTSKIQLI